jgi:hypothetical protein
MTQVSISMNHRTPRKPSKLSTEDHKTKFAHDLQKAVATENKLQCHFKSYTLKRKSSTMTAIDF